MSSEEPTFPMSFLRRLRFPQLFVLLGVLFLADLIVPDLIPLYDEVILGLLTLMVAAFRREKPRARGDDLEKPPEKNITPPSD